MLEGFSPPYENETWYSVFARYASRMRFGSPLLMRKAGYRDHSTLRIDIPRMLPTVEQQLYPRWDLSSERIVQNHTLLPVYLPFLDAKARERLLLTVHGEGPDSVIRCYSGPLRAKCRSFRYCPACVQDDRNRYGETYWHREHQLDWVGVCSKHLVFLESYCDQTWPHPCHEDLVVAEQSVKLVSKVREVNPKNPHHRLCLDIASDMVWLFAYRGTILEPEKLNQLYYWFAAGKHYITYQDAFMSPKWRQDLKRFLEGYADAVPKETGEKDRILLTRYIPRTVVNKHPVYHLLVARFFGHTIQSIAGVKEVPKVFGKGPWPCWNRTSSHYGQTVVTECAIEHPSINDQPIGTFACSCGSSYSRAGPDRSQEDAFRHDYDLRPRCNSRDSASVPTLEMQNNAIGASSSPIDRRGLVNRSLWSEWLEVTVLMNRRDWLNGIEMTPMASLRSPGIRPVFNTLLVYDPDWLSQHLPVLSPGLPSITNIWRQFGCNEEVLASAVFKVGTRLRRDPELQRRIDLALLADALHVEQSVLLVLPRRSPAKFEIDRTIETYERFAKRCLWHALRKYKRAGIVPSQIELLTACGLSSELLQFPAIKEIVQFALHQECPSHIWRGYRLGVPRLAGCQRCGWPDEYCHIYTSDKSIEPYWEEYQEKDRSTFSEVYRMLRLATFPTSVTFSGG